MKMLGTWLQVESVWQGISPRSFYDGKRRQSSPRREPKKGEWLVMGSRESGNVVINFYVDRLEGMGKAEFKVI